jgi:hypothetical protein
MTVMLGSGVAWRLFFAAFVPLATDISAWSIVFTF